MLTIKLRFIINGLLGAALLIFCARHIRSGSGHNRYLEMNDRSVAESMRAAMIVTRRRRTLRRAIALRVWPAEAGEERSEDALRDVMALPATKTQSYDPPRHGTRVGSTGA